MLLAQGSPTSDPEASLFLCTLRRTCVEDFCHRASPVDVKTWKELKAPWLTKGIHRLQVVIQSHARTFQEFQSNENTLQTKLHIKILKEFQAGMQVVVRSQVRVFQNLKSIKRLS
eukprot:gnl/MRDRNA2_/MRDRNA2_351092_c0_seq1.p2 gnl/MRDRNA2_/MRDRNA2_351092_c0~~gnl/MRDRNA2_/MRDRNA2_351092_c0_seq1.p2  ORF type:complete len:115 (-),score=18.08 gnl/MRDRNA2_/MRDRNA2_351092_c0_seq1:58-402(-)